MIALAYGDSQVGKTRLGAILATVFKEKYPDRRVLLVTAENYEPMESLISSGKVEVWRIQERDYPWEAISYACRGYWPSNPTDPHSRAVKLAPKDVSLWIFEGIASFCQLVMGDSRPGGITARVAAGEKIGPAKDDSAIVITEANTLSPNDKDKAFAVGFNAWQHHNYTQQWALNRVAESTALGTNVLWTTHLARGETRGVYVFGPASTGKAIVYELPKKFGPVLYMESEPNPDVNHKDEALYKIYIKEFWKPVIWEDERGRTLSQKVRVMASLRPPVGRESEVPPYFMADGKGVRDLLALINKFHNGKETV